MGIWYTRPVLFVADLSRTVDFYVGQLGFTEKWRFDEVVAQVNRDECEVIVSSQWPDKVGNGMLFIELTPADWKTLPEMLEAQSVGFTWGRWGYRTVIVDDPDGNQLFFPDPEDPGSM